MKITKLLKVFLFSPQSHNQGWCVHLRTSQPIKKTENKRTVQKIRVVCKDVGKLEGSYMAGGNVKWCTCFGKESGSSSSKELPDDTAILLLGI